MQVEAPGGADGILITAGDLNQGPRERRREEPLPPRSPRTNSRFDSLFRLQENWPDARENGSFTLSRSQSYRCISGLSLIIEKEM